MVKIKKLFSCRFLNSTPYLTSDFRRYINFNVGVFQTNELPFHVNRGVTESIKKYANQLGKPQLSKRKQWESFAWLCHLVGDLHQPLHAGYKDDRGGNYVKVSYKGETINLHQFWDSALINDRMEHQGDWQKPASAGSFLLNGEPWNPVETDAWTGESHRLARDAAYPPGEVIQAGFAENSWVLIRQQWLKAGERLARILNAVVGERDVEL